MADGLCAVDAGSAAEWKPVASVTETRCATHLARRIEATAAARGLPRAHPWTAPHPRGRSRLRQILVCKSLLPRIRRHKNLLQRMQL
jgi:hypothetical protein